MPNILETLLPTAAFDQVQVLDQDFNQVFPLARAIKAVVKEEARVMEHPLESGATITDHRVILPVEIELSFILPPGSYQDTYRQIRQFYLNATLLIVQTKSGAYYNQLIASMPHEENPDQYNALTLALTLKEAQFAVTAIDYSPKNPKQSSEVNRGAQQSTPAANNTVDPSALKYVSGSISNYFSRLFG
jgi:hypothetical protein